MPNVLITGASGLLGKAISKRLTEEGFSVLSLSRTKGKSKTSFVWDVLNNRIDIDAIKQADYIIHLAGEGIADKRWTVKRKQEIVESRVKSTALLLRAINETGAKPKAFISASAVGFYGAISSEKIYTETDVPANDFLGNSCRQWEESVDEVSQIGFRTVKFRIGVVLSKEGGAFPKMYAPFRFYAGAIIGSGKQYIPWVHIDDVARAFIFAIKQEHLQGVFNLVNPTGGCSNKEFTKTLARVCGRPLLLPSIPAFVLKVVLGEMASIVLEGSRVSSEKIQQAGFRFKYSNLNQCIEELL
jgi:uncharacterized protein